MSAVENRCADPRRLLKWQVQLVSGIPAHRFAASVIVYMGLNWGISLYMGLNWGTSMRDRTAAAAGARQQGMGDWH